MDAERNWYVYTLIDPRDGAVRYIGVSHTPRERLLAHLRESRTPTTHRHWWIASLLREGLEPIQQVIDQGQGDGWAEAERQWIARYRADGANLTNMTDGGDGTPGMSYTDEQRQRMSEARKGKPPHPNSVAAARTSWTGRKHSPESIEKMRQAQQEVNARPRSPARQAVIDRLKEHNKGRSMLPQVREALRQANTGRHPSEETRAKLRAAGMMREYPKGRPGPRLTEEARERIAAKLRGRKKPAAALEAMRQKLTGRPKSPEHIAKMRENAKKPVRCIETGDVFPSIAEAAAWAGIDVSTINRSIRERRPRGGYSWEYAQAAR